jgi:hypothetical protein
MIYINMETGLLLPKKKKGFVGVTCPWFYTWGTRSVGFKFEE